MYKKILIATDGSELATRGLSHGLELAKALNQPVTIVTATELWSALTMSHEAQHRGPNPVEQYEAAATEAAKKILASAEESANKLGIKSECVHIADRHPAEGIIETANSKGCDVIVIASHGRRGIQRTLLGSVATEVLSNSKVPVLVIR